MRILWAILLVGLALVWTAEAWLGESQSELDLRYGKPDRIAERGLEKSIFYNDDWYIFYFRLLNDKAEVMMVGLKKGREVDREIVNIFLKKNSIGNGFLQVKDDGKRMWFYEESSGREARWDYDPSLEDGTALWLATPRGQKLTQETEAKQTEKY